MADKNLSQELRRRILYYSALWILVSSTLIASVLMVELRSQMRRDAERNLATIAKGKAFAIEEYTSRARDVALQIASRSAIAEKLAIFNKGEISGDEVREFITPRLRDAFHRSRELAGLCRFDVRGNPVVQLGIAPPASFWPVIDKEAVETVIYSPISINGEYYLPISTPIESPSSEKIGTDLSLFNLSRVYEIIDDTTGMGRSGETIVRFEGFGENLPLFFLGQSKVVTGSASNESGLVLAAGKALEGESGMISAPDREGGSDLIAYAPGRESFWSVAVGMDKEEVYRSASDRIAKVGLLILVMVSGGTSGMVLVLRPLTGRMILQSGELQQEIDQKTEALQKELAERQRAEDQLAASERLFRKLFEESPIGIAFLGKQREVILTNQRYRDFLGYSEAEIIERGPRGLLHPDDYEPSMALSTKLRAGEISLFHMEQRYLRKDGTIVWADTQITVLRDKDGQLINTIGWVQDITVRRRIEEELRRSHDELSVKVAERTADLVQANEMLQREITERKLAQQRTEAHNDLLALATEASSRKEYLDGVVALIQKWSNCCCIGIRVLDEGGNIPYESYLGFSRDFWEQENWLCLTRDNCVCIRVITGQLEPQDASSLSLGGSFAVNDSAKFVETLSEQELKRFRGTCIRSGFLSIAVIPIRDRTGVVGIIHLADMKPEMVPEGLIHLIESLTALIGEAIGKFRLKDALKSHYEAKLRLAAIVESSNDAIISRDLDGNITSWNAAAERIYGYTAKEVIGQPITLLHPPESIAESRKMLRRAERGERIIRYETVRLKKDGSRIDVSISVSPIVNASGDVFGVSSLHRDISDRKRAEIELKDYTAKLELANRELQDFAFIASHDLKEPLRKVTSFGCRLEEKYGSSLWEEGKDFLNRMLSATRRMENLLTALLDYSRVTTQAKPFSDVDLSSIVREVLSDLEVRIATTGGEVHVGELPILQADPTQMRQLFQNLIANALKFHKEGRNPTVKVCGCPTGLYHYEISIEDNGIGFEEEHLERIFAPFQRLHGRNSRYEGTGMGLAICKKIVERHGGTITARSAPGQGAAFIVTLPLKQDTTTS